MKIKTMKFLVCVLTLAFLGSVRSQTVNGNWGSWTSYGACSVTCGVGTKQRSRECNNPAPSGGGTQCPGDSTESQTCFVQTCYPSILGSLERNCSWTYYGCKDGAMACIDFSFRCDGNNDCDDGSDESPAIAGCPTDCSDGADAVHISKAVLLLITGAVMTGKYLRLC